MTNITKLATAGRPPERYTTAHRIAIIDLVRRDMAAKAIAAEVGVAHATVCRLAVRAGYRRMYLTDDERAEVLDRRRIAGSGVAA